MDYLFARSNLGLASAGANRAAAVGGGHRLAPLAYWRSRLGEECGMKTRSLARFGVYGFLSAAAFFLVPLTVMLTTSFKSMDEIRAGSIFALPLAPSLDAWRAAWSEACTGVDCGGERGLLELGDDRRSLPSCCRCCSRPSMAMRWRGGSRAAQMALRRADGGRLHPDTGDGLPLVKLMAAAGLYSPPGIVLVHLVFVMPVMTLLFATTTPACRRSCSRRRASTAAASGASSSSWCCPCPRPS